MIKVQPIDENTPKDRPIIVFAYEGEGTDGPVTVQASVVEWFATGMKRYIDEQRKRFPNLYPEEYDYSDCQYWGMINCPQGSIDSFCGFEPTHWADIPTYLEDKL